MPSTKHKTKKLLTDISLPPYPFVCLNCPLISLIDKGTNECMKRLKCLRNI